MLGDPLIGGPSWARRLGFTAASAFLAVALGCGEPAPSAPDVDPEVQADDDEEGPQIGRWRRSRDLPPETADLTPEQRREIQRLEAIGYASGSQKIQSDRIITTYDAERAHNGYNLYTSGHAPVAILTDMKGRERHRWSFDFREIWPERELARRMVRNTEFWRRAHLWDNGDLLVIFDALGLVKLDRDSNVLWSNDLKSHHDFEVTENGDIYALTRKAQINPRINESRAVLEDYITVFDSDGNEKHSFSLLDAIERSQYANLWETLAGRHGDITHTNTLEVLDGSIADRAPAFRRGNLLISILMLNAIAVVDVESETVVWAHQGDFLRQHDPTVLENGNLLLFDNGARRRRSSSVIEIDPVTTDIRWQYGRDEDQELFSMTCGTAQRLENGNTLITETDGGRALEVTPDGETVWEFYSPHRAGENGEFIATLFEVIRLPPDFPVDWAKER